MECTLIMKTLTLLLSLISFNLFGQCDPDTEPPYFDLPYYLELETYDGLENVPSFEFVDDWAFETLTDNCDTIVGPTITSVDEYYDGYVIYDFYAYDAAGNYNSQELKLYYNKSAYPTPTLTSGLIYDLRGVIQKEPLKSGIYILKEEGKPCKLIIK